MKKKIKAPGTFSKISGYIAAVFFALYVFIDVAAKLITIFTNDSFSTIYVNFSADRYLLYAAFIFAALLLLFKNVKLLPIPFAVYMGLECFWFISSIISIVKHNLSINISSVLYRFVNLTYGLGFLLMVIMVVLALIKATRKITVVWFIPVIVIGLASLLCVTADVISVVGYLIDGILSHMMGIILLVHIPTVIEAAVLLIATVFTGIAIRAYAKQKMFDDENKPVGEDVVIEK